MGLHGSLQSGVRAKAVAAMERGPTSRAALHEVYPGVEKAQLTHAEGDAGRNSYWAIWVAVALVVMWYRGEQCLAASCTCEPHARRAQHARIDACFARDASEGPASGQAPLRILEDRPRGIHPQQLLRMTRWRLMMSF